MKTRGKIIINFEATVEQRDRIKELAALHGLTQAEYLRMKALENPILVEEAA
jgi:hypothetical protein